MTKAEKKICIKECKLIQIKLFAATIPFTGIEIIKNATGLETRVYRKPTNTGRQTLQNWFIEDHAALRPCSVI